MKKNLIFVTGNSGKFEEAQKIFVKHAPEIQLIQEEIDIDEIQSLDLKKIAIDKAHKAWHHVKKPLIIDDGGFFLSAYNAFPGALSKFVMQGIGIEGIFKLAERNKEASFRNYFVYIDRPGSYELFEGVCKGTFVRPEKCIVDKRLPFRAYFKPEGSEKTYAELAAQETNEFHDHHRVKSLKKFIHWYRSKFSS